MKSAVTISLVEEARGGPFVFWGNFRENAALAASLGFDAVEIFPPDAATLSQLDAKQVVEDLGIRVAAVGTGAGWVKRKLSLADESLTVRQSALEFVKRMIDAAATLDAPAILGSMQGRSSANVSSHRARGYLREALEAIEEHIQNRFVKLLYEPLNRYETDQANTIEQAYELVHDLSQIEILADWFHMNIEESDMAGALSRFGSKIGHIHFADTNRSAVGLGHLDVPPLIDALKRSNYSGYLSAEVFAKPDSYYAAKTTIDAFRKYVKM